MTALAAARSTIQVGSLGLPAQTAYLVADNVKIYPGALCALTTAGYVAPATAAASLVAVGRYGGTRILDNTVTGHAAGAFSVPIDHGDFWWNNKAADLVTQAMVGTVCYIEDDNTVRLTSTSTSAAGKVVAVDSTLGVLVRTVPL
jgi:hypothetical protein